MLRAALLAALAAGALAAFVSLGGATGQRSSDERLLETINLARGQSQRSDTSFTASQNYRLLVSGNVEQTCPDGPPNFGLRLGADAFYLHDQQSQGDSGPQPPQKHVNLLGTPWDANLVPIPAYEDSHSYTLDVRPTQFVNGHFTFSDKSPSAGEGCTVTGQYTIHVYLVENGTTKTVNEPKPGDENLIDSPDLPQLSKEVDIVLGNSDGRFGGNAVAAEGEIIKVKGFGKLVAACWLTYDFQDSDGHVIALTPERQLYFCLILVSSLFRHHGEGPVVPAVARELQSQAGPGAKGCRTKRIAIAVTLRKGRAVSVKRATDQRLRRSSVRYSCSAGGGDVRLKVSAVKPLRTLLGKKLTLGVARAKNAPRRTGKLSLTFGWK